MTRLISVTHESETCLETGARILADLQGLERAFSGNRQAPKGLLRVNATFGFGRRRLEPAIVDFARPYANVEVRLELTDRPLNLVDQAFDIGIWSGTVPGSGLVARRVAANRRVLCVSPDYLARYHMPVVP